MVRCKTLEDSRKIRVNGRHETSRLSFGGVQVQACDLRTRIGRRVPAAAQVKIVHITTIYPSSFAFPHNRTLQTGSTS